MYTKAVEIASGSRSSCVDCADPAVEFLRRCASVIVSMWTLFSWRSVSLLGSGSDGQAAPDGDAPRMPDYVDSVIAGDTQVMPDDVDPVIPVTDAPMTPGVDAPMVPDAGAPAILGDTVLRSGWNLGTWLGIMITQSTSSETRNGSLSVYDVAGGSVPYALLACVPSNVSWMLGLDLVMTAS